MGLLDYYRQFEGMSEEEVNQGLREQAAERRRKALTRVETLDLSLTTWPELPHPRIVGAITFVARRGLHRYPQLSGSDLRDALAERHGVDPDRLILGNGAAELLSAATRALIEPGQQLLTRWPSYPLYPIMARRAHGRAVRVTGGVDALLEARPRAGCPRDRAGEPERSHRRAPAGGRAGAAARGAARRRRGPARRVAGRVRRRAARQRVARAARAPSAPARLPQLLQGLGAGRPAHRLRARRPRLRAICWPSSSPTWGSPRSPRRAPSRRCAAALS